jgi:hypothetical protein
MAWNQPMGVSAYLRSAVVALFGCCVAPLLLPARLAPNTSAAAGPVAWEGADGLAPWDPAVPASRRFAVNFPGPPDTAAVVAGGVLRVRDGSAGSSVDVTRPVAVGVADDWVVQETLRVIDHQRPGLPDFAATFGLQDPSRQAYLAVARDRIGILTFGGGGYVDGTTYALDTTDRPHLYRVVRGGPSVSVYVDDTDVARLTVPYASLAASDGTGMAILTNTSSFGTASFDVSAFAYDVGTTQIPEPTATVATIVAGAAAWGGRRRRP